MKTRSDRDTVILNAARSVLLRDPSASMAAIATAAGVGMSALYLRFPSKEILLQKLSLQGLEIFAEITEQAITNNAPMDIVFPRWTEQLLLADTLSLGPTLAGTFEPTDEHARLAQVAMARSAQLVERAREAEILSPSVNLFDVILLIEALGTIWIGEEERSREARIRLLRLALTGLISAPPNADLESEVTMEEIVGRWSKTNTTPR